MSSGLEPHLQAAQQYFPTYKLKPERAEIGVKEFELSAQALSGDQRGIAAATGFVVLAFGATTTVLGSSVTSAFLRKLVKSYGYHFEALALIIIVVISLLSTIYFAGLQKSATYAARKMVVLRRLLGIDYGNIETVLPTDRVEGANEPFAIPMFPGWMAVSTIPAILIAVALASLTLILALTFQTIPGSAINAASASAGIAGMWPPYLCAAVVGAGTLLFYRRLLFEQFESVRLFAGRAVGVEIGIRVKQRIGHVLYRMTLSVQEAKRLGIDLSAFHKMLVRVEDRRFYSHNGNSLLSVASAAGRYLRYRKQSGGSTIEQQLVRSNFLSKLKPALPRKLVEWILAPWLSRLFSKHELLDLYLCSVRFERGVIGLPAAIGYFFPGHPPKRALSRARTFLLIERLSNVTSSFHQRRVQALVWDLLREGLLTSGDVPEINVQYAALAAAHKIQLGALSRPGLTPSQP